VWLATWVVLSDECHALVAEASGPLQRVTVAATEQRNPTATARPAVSAIEVTIVHKCVD